MGRVEQVMVLVCGWGSGRLSPTGLLPEPLDSDVAPLTWFRLLNFSGTFLSYGWGRVLGSLMLMVGFKWVFINVWMSMLFRSECFCFWDRGDWIWIKLTWFELLLTFPGCLPYMFLFPRESCSLKHFDFHVDGFPEDGSNKSHPTCPSHSVLDTPPWSRRGGYAPPPLPWIFMRASGGTRQWNLMEVMLHDLQGWVTKGSDFCLSPSFGTLALSSQAQCLEEPSRSMRWGPHGEPAASANARCVSECPFSDSRPQTLWNRLSPSLLCPVQVPDASNSWT